MTSQTFNIPVCFPQGQQFLLLRYLFGCCFYSFHAEAVLYKETQKPDKFSDKQKMYTLPLKIILQEIQTKLTFPPS